MAHQLTLNKHKISAQLEDLRNAPSEWELEYDTETDQLFYGIKKIPRGYFLVQLDDEISLFVNKQSRVCGMFIEYFKDNYLEHNKKLEPIIQVLVDTKSITEETLEKERIALENELFAEALTSIKNKPELVTAIA